MLEAEVITSEAAGGAMLPAVLPTQQKCDGIAILGSHPATVMNAPFGDPTWKIYACSPDNTPFGRSNKAGYLPRVDEWFEVHDPIEDPTRCFGYLKAVSEMPFVWMRDKRALAQGVFKGGREYPEAALKGTSTFQKVQRQNPDGTVTVQMVEIPNSDGLFCPYMFTSSIAYMLAKAIVDCEESSSPAIGLWGIMQASEGEYAYQRPGIQYFLGEAMKRGIKVIANRESCLFDMPQWKW
jgi:hypothetical protein